MKTSALGALIVALLAATTLQAEDIVVIVNPAAKPISKEQIADLYLGRTAELTPLDQTAGSAIYVQFYGRGLPPKQLPDSEAVKKAVAANPNVVGYIEKSAVDASVKVALPLD
jgi:ABC-type phosphate transport system substrate-binding protein